MQKSILAQVELMIEYMRSYYKFRLNKPVSSSLRDIRLFVAAYEERSFTAAARR
jgi:hypothetical protein